MLSLSESRNNWGYSLLIVLRISVFIEVKESSEESLFDLQILLDWWELKVLDLFSYEARKFLASGMFKNVLFVFYELKGIYKSAPDYLFCK